MKPRKSFFQVNIFLRKSGKLPKGFGQRFFFVVVVFFYIIFQLDLQGFIQGERNWPIFCLNDLETQESEALGELTSSLGNQSVLVMLDLCL